MKRTRSRPVTPINEPERNEITFIKLKAINVLRQPIEMKILSFIASKGVFERYLCVHDDKLSFVVILNVDTEDNDMKTKLNVLSIWVDSDASRVVKSSP